MQTYSLLRSLIFYIEEPCVNPYCEALKVLWVRRMGGLVSLCVVVLGMDEMVVVLVAVPKGFKI